MKRKRLVVTFFLSVSLVLCKHVYGFGNKETHPALTEKAVEASNPACMLDGYLKTQLGLLDGIKTELHLDFGSYIKKRLKAGKAKPKQTTRTILEWMKAGSNIEDETLYQARSRHHFHDPTRNAGLDNRTDHPYWKGAPTKYSPFDLTGESALVWTTKGTAQKKPKVNPHSWKIARGFFKTALTFPEQSTREVYLASTFLDLGCISHLIEDLGVPAHARNDWLFSHYRTRKDYGNPLEDWVEKKIGASGIPGEWLTGWTPQAKAFDKLTKYFDSDAYTGQYVGASPSSDWGLSEQTNYQFLSWSTMFVLDYFPWYSLYSFPHPSLTKIDSITEDKRRYISGYGINHLAWVFTRDEYLGGESKYRNMPYAVIGDKVCLDYAKITIPRTIDYTTGLINYFFRGRLSAEQTGGSGSDIVITITNNSNNSGVGQTLKGGTFELYWDNNSESVYRSKVDDFTVYRPGLDPAPGNEWDEEDTELDFEGTTKATFSEPTPPEGEEIEEYILVYKGNISENPDDPDPDDLNAIAVGLCPSCCYELGDDCPICNGRTPAYLDLTLSNLVTRTGCQNWESPDTSPSQIYAGDVSAFENTYRLDQGGKDFVDKPLGWTQACSWGWRSPYPFPGGNLTCYDQENCIYWYDWWRYTYKYGFAWVIYNPVTFPTPPHVRVVMKVSDTWGLCDWWYEGTLCDFYPTEEDLIKCLEFTDKNYNLTIEQSPCCISGTVKLEMN